MPPSTPIPPAWAAAIEQYALHLRTCDRTPATIRARRDQIQHAARRLPADPRTITPVQVLEYVGAQDWMPETRRGRYAALRDFWRWAKRSGVAEINAAKRLPRVRATEPNPDPVPQAVYEDAMRRADDRTKLIMRLAHDAGLRRSEIAQIHPDRDLRQDLVGWSLVVHGKGRKVRMVPLTPRLALDLRALGSGYAFSGKIDGHLSPRRVYELVDDVLPGHWSLHNLRHSFATNTHEATNGDTLTVQGLLGHASPATTGRYVRVSNARGRAAVYAAAGYAAPEQPERKLVAV